MARGGYGGNDGSPSAGEWGEASDILAEGDTMGHTEEDIPAGLLGPG